MDAKKKKRLFILFLEKENCFYKFFINEMRRKFMKTSNEEKGGNPFTSYKENEFHWVI